MAESIPPRIDNDMAEPSRPEPGPAPPPLTAIRVKGPGPKGLNKPAILSAVGGGIAIILVLASGGLTADPSRNPLETKPMMSDPARPEMARGAVRDLPVDYGQAAIQQAQLQPAPPPLLGPPLPGDVSAFAPDDATLRPRQQTDDWSEAGYSSEVPVDPGVVEAEQADRSQIFFAMRQDPSTSVSSTQSPQTPSLDQRSASIRSPANQAPTIPSNERVLFPGAVIPASLLTEISSESPGPVIAQVTQAIYDSATGRTLLIPQGARLIGDYESSTRYGQSRIAIVWSRIIMPDGDEIALNEAAHDPSGATGVSGEVDNHWLDVFGAATLGTLINIGVASSEDPQLTFGGVGVVPRDPVDGAIAEGVQRNASIVTNRVVDRSLAIPPTIRVEAGKRISVIVTSRMNL